MAASRSDRFYAVDPANPPEPGSEVVSQDGSPADLEAGEGLFSSDADVAASRACATITIAVPGAGRMVFAGETRFLSDGQRIFFPTDGQSLRDGTFVEASFLCPRKARKDVDCDPACFTTGTLIETISGPVLIEELEIGDEVVTLDNGPCPVQWIGRREVIATGRHAPVRFAASTIGNRRALLVSPQQRVLIAGWRAEFLFGIEEALVPARYLVDGTRIVFEPLPRIEYVHLLFDGHEILLAEGAPIESFHPADWAEEREARHQWGFAAIFPDAVGCRPRMP